MFGTPPRPFEVEGWNCFAACASTHPFGAGRDALKFAHDDRYVLKVQGAEWLSVVTRRASIVNVLYNMMVMIMIMMMTMMTLMMMMTMMMKMMMVMMMMMMVHCYKN